jgi:hypothetical protein
MIGRSGRERASTRRPAFRSSASLNRGPTSCRLVAGKISSFKGIGIATAGFQQNSPQRYFAERAFAMVTLVNKFRPVALCLLVLLTACSSVQTGQQSSTVSGPSPNLATVYFYRSHNSPGAAVGVDIKDNGIDIGTVQDGTYFVYHTNPGQHALTATTDTASTQNFKLQAGAIYYMEAVVISRQHLFQPSIRVVFDLQGQTAIQNLKRVRYYESH